MRTVHAKRVSVHVRTRRTRGQRRERAAPQGVVLVRGRVGGRGRRAGVRRGGGGGGSWGPSEGRWTSRPRPRRWPRFNKHKTTDDDSNRVHPIRRYAARRPPVDARGHGTPRADAMVGNIARARGTCVREPEDAHKHESAYKSIWKESASSEEARGAWRCVTRPDI